MAVNPDTSLPNRHSLYLACSGGGKSQALYQNADIPRRGVWHVFYDPDEDHPARRFYTMASFKAGLKAAIRDAQRRKGGFRIAYCGDADLKSFEAWCALIWAIMDGGRLVYITIEELAAVTDTAGKASPNFGRLLNRSRKYGGVISATTQRGTEISKTAYVQCGTKIVGIQEGADVERMAKLCALRPDQIRELQPLEYWVKRAGREPERLKLDYKPIPRG